MDTLRNFGRSPFWRATQHPCEAPPTMTRRGSPTRCTWHGHDAMRHLRRSTSTPPEPLRYPKWRPDEPRRALCLIGNHLMYTRVIAPRRHLITLTEPSEKRCVGGWMYRPALRPGPAKASCLKSPWSLSRIASKPWQGCHFSQPCSHQFTVPTKPKTGLCCRL